MRLDVSDGALYLEEKNAVEMRDAWLRLNNDGDFTSGVYTPNTVRIDGTLQVGSTGQTLITATTMTSSTTNTFNGTSTFNSKATFDALAEFISSSGVTMNYGFNGNYTGTGAGTGFGATIWAIDTAYHGTVPGTNGGVPSYGIDWRRSAHSGADAQVSEGLYIERASAQIAAFGNSGAKFVSYIYPGNQATGNIGAVTGNYGSINVNGAQSGGYAGVNVGGRLALMNNTGTTGGLYDDTNNGWILKYIENSYVSLYEDGLEEARTQQSAASDTYSGLLVKNEEQTLIPVGFAAAKRNDFSANTTVVEADWGQSFRHTSGTAHNLTFTSETRVPQDTFIIIQNGSGSAGGVVTLVSSGTTWRHYTGSTLTSTTGNLSLAGGGVAVVMKLTDTTHLIWGIGIS